jgi:RNA recognition motif-containing protein
MHDLRESREMRIYVGNLPYSVTDEELRDTFGEFGELVSAEVVTDRFSGQSKGFGFVEMPNNSEADQAIKALNDQPLKGRKLTVNEARPRADRNRRGGGGGGGGGGGSYR